ncbi:MAG: glycoside hydrolase 100 family protein [Anaerolineae bacterium]
MDALDKPQIESAKQAATDVLLHNAVGPFQRLPRTAGWGYPEPYTRDWMISALGILASGNVQLIEVVRNVLETAARNQSSHGLIPSLIHDPLDRGASDTTPLFLLAVGAYRKTTGEANFLENAVRQALAWMEYQSPTDRFLVAQQPTSDWRDEQWVLGYGLFVNASLYGALRLLGQDERADGLSDELNGFAETRGRTDPHVPEGLAIQGKPYFALWSYKVYSSDGFDLLGNSLAILSGLTSASRAGETIDWVEAQCAAMKGAGDLALELPPNFFPFIHPGDSGWLPRYEHFNLPGDYHNGGVWPFVCGFYVAALVAARRFELAEQKLLALTRLVKLSHRPNIGFGFNEWFKAQDGKPMGQDWQTWSAAMYLYASWCVEERRTPFFDEMRATNRGH